MERPDPRWNVVLPKFQQVSKAVLDEKGVLKVIDLVENLDSLDNLEELMRIIRA